MKSCEKCWGTGRDLDQRELGQKAREVREKAGVMLKDQARRLGMSASNLCLLEQGRRTWRRDHYEKVIKP